MKKPTSHDVAKLAGVSQTTVSQVLNNSDKISFSPQTRERVLAAAQTLGYRVPARAGKSAKKTTGRILVLTPTLTNYFFTELLQYIQTYLNQSGYQALVCNTFRNSEIERFYLEENLEHVDGILYTFLPGFPELIDQINKTKPVVLIGEKREGLNICSIELSNRNSGSIIAEYLYGLGHRRFVFLSTPLNSYSLSREQRLEGMRSVFQKNGLQDAIKVVAPESASETETNPTGFSYEYEVGLHLGQEAIQNDCYGATAFICVNDMTALGTMEALARNNVRVPEDISVCGFDNIFPATIIKPGLTTVDHQMKARCKYAVDMILSLQKGADGALPMVNKVEYAPQLVVRGSTGPV